MKNNTQNKKDDMSLTTNPAQQLIEDSMKTSEDANKLSTIRDILFGEQAREDEEKRNSLHKKLNTNLGQLQQETQNQFKQISAEIEKLYQLINTETEQRITAGKGAGKQTELLQQSLDESNKNHQQAQKQLQTEFTQATDELNKQAQQRHDELSNKLEQAAKELRSDKTDRGDLANMLRGMAEQLANEKD